MNTVGASWIVTMSLPTKISHEHGIEIRSELHQRLLFAHPIELPRASKAENVLLFVVMVPIAIVVMLMYFSN